tara:strand:+ start:762 stop:938 length:177 start_codon:yes stop_codon:yes gene_type:complete
MKGYKMQKLLNQFTENPDDLKKASKLLAYINKHPFSELAMFPSELQSMAIKLAKEVTK